MNGSNSAEDADMAANDDEKVVTMMDVLQEQEEFEEDANAVLGASDDKNCTYSKGYVKRQAIYACLTCCPEAKADPMKRAGVCLACSLHCHENHELVELYTKRNFRCDCGNPKFNSNPCSFTPNKHDLNYENKYNQNFSGVYCTCHRPYPDPESTEEDEMIQCIVCEDWLHTTHLEATVPLNDQYAEMVCKDCMEDNDFLHDYSDLVINTVDKEITEEDSDLYVDVTSIVKKSTVSNSDMKKQENLVNETNEVASTDDKEASTDDKEASTVDKEEASTDDKEASTDDKEASIDDKEEASTDDKEEASTDDKEASTDDKEASTDHKDASSDDKLATIDDKVASTDDEMSSNNDDKMQDKVSDDVEMEKTNDENNGESKNDEEASIQTNIGDEISANSTELEKSDDTSENAMAETNSVENGLNDKATTLDKTSDKISSDIIQENVAEGIVGSTTENDTLDHNSSDITTDNVSVDTVKLTTETTLENNETELEAITNKEPNAESQDKMEEDKLLENDNEAKENMESNTENADSTDDKNSHLNSETTERTDKTEKLDALQIESTSSVDNNGITEINDIKINNSKELPNSVENKRKLSIEDAEDGVDVKKLKLDTKPCLRPKGVKRVYKGATFWPSNFRQKLCTCNECISMYKDLAVLFLVDLDDTVTAYEALGKEKTDGCPSSQYEKGLQALSSLDRVQQINALTEYNKMRDKLLDFLKSFKDRKEIVKEEDIKAFFAGMKPKREPDGVYFCR